MAVAAVNLTIDKGTDFSLAMKIRSDGAPINLVGYGFSCVMKKHYSATKSYGIGVTALTPESNGVVRLSMSSEDTYNLPTGRYVYDLLITSAGGNTTKPVEGNVIVKGTTS
jgi:hypothetical protein